MPNCLTGDVLWEQIPDSVDGTGIACQLDSVYPFDADVVDDVSIPLTGWRIDSIKTWWRNWSFQSWNYVPNFHLMLYSDNSGAPSDSPSFEFVIQKEHYTVYENWPQEKYSVVLDLTQYSVEILDSGTWWIEVQPSNVFAGGNGQTGWQSSVGIGNGHELYQRFPLIGYMVWQSASSIHGHAYETGMIVWGEYLNQVMEEPVYSDNSRIVDVRKTVFSNREKIYLEIEILDCQDMVLEIYDISGRSIFSEEYMGLNPGIHCFDIDSDQLKNSFSGLYVFRITVNRNVYSGKMILL
ncbi:hypothetical protein JW890_02455 [candidate division WOR-3 bacterium]|nr:hypothetical protein [candidate division WOR-3 bacterium]